MQQSWPSNMQVAQIRIARPTHQLKEVVQFYCEGLGLKQIGSFTGHEGYDGAMIGLPNADYHLEFTEHEEGLPCPPPSKDNLLVFYIPNQLEIELIQDRMKVMGYTPVSPENPYWEKEGITIEDPDGWRIVLMNTAGI